MYLSTTLLIPLPPCLRMVQSLSISLFLWKLPLIVRSFLVLMSNCSRSSFVHCMRCYDDKQCASNQKDFTSVKFTTQLFSSADESLKDETRLLLLGVSSVGTLYTCVFTHITSVVKPMHNFMARSRVPKSRLYLYIVKVEQYLLALYPAIVLIQSWRMTNPLYIITKKKKASKSWFCIFFFLILKVKIPSYIFVIIFIYFLIIL